MSPPAVREMLVFGGLPEVDGWRDSPLHSRDIVHFRSNLALPLDLLRAALPAGVTVSLDDGQGLYRVQGAQGAGGALAEFVKSWCQSRGFETIGLRPDSNVRRRTLSSLPPEFLADLCQYYGPYSMRLLQRRMTTIRLHISDPDDVRQRVAEWVLEAVGRYDATLGVPFGAYLAERLSKWVHELGRNTFGRAAVDVELRQQRAIAIFQQSHQHRPCDAELADILGQSLATVRRNAQTIAVMSGLRNIASLDDHGDGFEIPLADGHDVNEDIMSDIHQSLLSQTLTASCAAEPRSGGRAGATPNVLGWVTWYETTWGGKTKTELARALGTSTRNMNVHGDRAGVRMRARLADDLD